MAKTRRGSPSVKSSKELHVKVKVEGSVYSVEAEGIFKIIFEPSGPVLPGADEMQNFAAWAVLPIAMKRGQNVIIDGIGDQATEENAAKLSEIWADWMPKKLTEISLRFQARPKVVPPPSQGELVLYSGGVDSTHSLILRSEAGKSQTLLTIHGLDYRAEDSERFQALIAKTDAFARSHTDTRLFVKTNIYQVYEEHRVNVDQSHGFALAASAFLWEGKFRNAEIAADFARFQEFYMFPWGTNSVTNEFFRSANYHLNTACLETTRAEKTRVLAQNPVALGSLSFCKDYSARPENCGVCMKCTRTKAMFLACLKYSPEIFLDNSWCAEFLNEMDLEDPHALRSLLDLRRQTIKNNSEEFVPGVVELFENYLHPSAMQKVSRKMKLIFGK